MKSPQKKALQSGKKKQESKPALGLPPWLFPLSIAFVTFAVYFPSLNNGFTNWDDPAYVYENKLITDFSFAGIKHLFTVYLSGNYHPLVLLSFAAEYHFFNLDPKIYHTTNLLLHIANSLLVFAIVKKLSGSNISGFIAGLLFGIHPLHVESVAWIAERKDVLYACFFLLSAFVYMKYKEAIKKSTLQIGAGRRVVVLYLLALFLFLLSCLSKGQAVVLPLVLILFDFLLTGKWFDRKALLDKIPFLITALIFGIVALNAQKSGGNIREANNFNFLDNLVIGLNGSVFYLYKTVLPLNLSGFYPYPVKNGAYLSLSFYLTAFLALVIMLVAAYARKYSGRITAGFLLFLICLLPVMQILPVGNAMVADRYFYISSIGIFFLIGEGFAFFYTPESSFPKYSRTIAALVLSVFVLFFIVTSRERVKVWNNSFSFWEDIALYHPTAALAYNSLGNAYEKSGEYEKAIDNFMLAIKADSSDAKTFNNIANNYDKLEKYDLAIENYLHALRLKPNDPMAYTNLGNTYDKIGNTNEAIAAHEKSISIVPSPLGFSNLANAYMRIGDYEKAILFNRKAITMAPDYALAYNNLGAALMKKGQNDEALENLKRAARLNYPLAQDYLQKIGEKW